MQFVNMTVGYSLAHSWCVPVCTEPLRAGKVISGYSGDRHIRTLLLGTQMARKSTELYIAQDWDTLHWPTQA